MRFVTVITKKRKQGISIPDLHDLSTISSTKQTFIDGYVCLLPIFVTCLELFHLRWVRTGDEAYINEKYEVFIVDRLKEIMKVRGFQVAPAEL